MRPADEAPPESKILNFVNMMKRIYQFSYINEVDFIVQIRKSVLKIYAEEKHASRFNSN